MDNPDNFSTDIDAAIKSIENLKNVNNDLFGTKDNNTATQSTPTVT